MNRRRVIPRYVRRKRAAIGTFGMKLHIGVDSRSGLAHSAVVTTANVHDKHAMLQLLHGQERRVYGDNAYVSQKARIHGKAPKRATSRIDARVATA
ncbi:MAG: transposase [Burkholderia sp.]